MNATPIVYSSESGNQSNTILISFEDVTEQKKAEEELRFLGLHDSLTGLPNRLLFYDRLGIAIENAKRNGNKLAVMMIDIDNFKLVNDTRGHDQGDELIKSISVNMQKILRKADTIARIGGDEFILLVTNMKSENDAVIIAEKVNQTIDTVISLENYKGIKISASIGIVIYPENGNDINTLIKNADEVMYDVKKSGKGRFSFYKM